MSFLASFKLFPLSSIVRTSAFLLCYHWRSDVFLCLVQSYCPCGTSIYSFLARIMRIISFMNRLLVIVIINCSILPSYSEEMTFVVNVVGPCPIVGFFNVNVCYDVLIVIDDLHTY